MYCLFTSTDLNINVALFAKHDGVFEVEVEQDDHLAVARLVECVFDVVVEDVNLKRNQDLTLANSELNS